MLRHLRVIALCLVIAPALFAQNLDMGSTYESIDRLAVSVTTTFTDGTVARTERLGDGLLQTTLRDAQGRVVARLDADAGELRFRVTAATDGSERTYAAHTERVLTADWINAQVHRTWSETSFELAAGAPTLTWRGDFLTADQPRAGRAEMAVGARFSRDAEAAGIASVVTDFGGVEARSRRHDSADPSRPNWTTGLYVTGITESALAMAWIESTQTLHWRLPDGSLGEVGPTTFPEGWTRFRPNQAWANVQAFSFYRYALEHGQIQFDPIAPSRDRLTIVANADMDGCTGLHWLDNTILRACCDEHDRCYNKQNPNCTAWSWIWPGSWHCFMCNVRVVQCFLTASGGGGGGTGGGGTRNQDTSSCSRIDGACPAYCYVCD